MAGNLRFCLFSGTQGVLDVPKEHQLKGTQSRGPRYSGGPFSEAFNFYIEAIVGHDLINYTAVVKNLVGNFNSTSGHFDENSCLYSIQSNESDFGTVWTHRPMPVDSLKEFPPYMDDNIYIFSKYIVSDEVKTADIVKSLIDVFSPKVWLSGSLFTFIFWSLIKLHITWKNKFRKKKLRDDSLYKVLTQLLQIDHISYRNLSMRIVSLFLTIFSFYALAYFTLSMKTDIVVVTEPKVINSYDDLLAKPHIKMVFPKIVDNFKRFEHAEPHRKERKLWQKSLKEVKGDRSKMMFHFSSGDFASGFQLLENVDKQSGTDTVAMMSDFSKGSLRYSLCLLKVSFLYRQLQPYQVDEKRRFSRIYSWLSRDPDSEEFIATWVHSVHYKSLYLRKIYKRTAWAFSLGLVKMVLINLNKPPMEIVKIANSEEGDTYRNCLADNYRDNLPQVQFSAFTPAQFRNLTEVYFILILTAAIYLIFEFFQREYSTVRVT